MKLQKDQDNLFVVGNDKTVVRNWIVLKFWYTGIFAKV